MVYDVDPKLDILAAGMDCSIYFSTKHVGGSCIETWQLLQQL